MSYHVIITNTFAQKTAVALKNNNRYYIIFVNMYLYLYY